jgi:hypothetical protein
MNDPHDDTYEYVPPRIVGQITGPIVPIRDDTAEPNFEAMRASMAAIDRGEFRPIEEVIDEFSGQVHDDTAEPFPISGNGPLTAHIDAWPSPEPYPLHSFEVPPPRASRPSFVSVNLARAVIDAHQQGNQAAFAVAIEQLADAIDGGRNMNSGPLAPIQGE